MKLFIAGASSELDVVRYWMRLAREANFEITHDWTEPVAQANAKTNLRKCALDDLRGIDLADGIWILSPDRGSFSTGLWAELGYSLAKGVQICLSGETARDCIYSHLADNVIDTHDEAFEFIRGAWL